MPEGPLLHRAPLQAFSVPQGPAALCLGGCPGSLQLVRGGWVHVGICAASWLLMTVSCKVLTTVGCQALVMTVGRDHGWLCRLCCAWLCCLLAGWQLGGASFGPCPSLLPLVLSGKQSCSMHFILPDCDLQFPDPHFKKKHKKRRVVQPQLIEAIERRLAPGGLVFLQSDVMEVSCHPAPGSECKVLRRQRRGQLAC